MSNHRVTWQEAVVPAPPASRPLVVITSAVIVAQTAIAAVLLIGILGAAG